MITCILEYLARKLAYCSIKLCKYYTYKYLTTWAFWLSNYLLVRHINLAGPRSQNTYTVKTPRYRHTALQFIANPDLMRSFPFPPTLDSYKMFIIWKFYLWYRMDQICACKRLRNGLQRDKRDWFEPSLFSLRCYDVT